MSDVTKRGARMSFEVFEIESLNIDQLDVEELEQRIELSAGVPTEMGWVCSCDNECNGLCTSYCGTQCTCDVQRFVHQLLRDAVHVRRHQHLLDLLRLGLLHAVQLSVLDGLRHGRLRDPGTQGRGAPLGERSDRRRVL